MTADVEQLGRRDEIAQLIEGHLKIVRVLLPDHQTDGARSWARTMFSCHIHRALLSQFESGLRAAKVKAPQDRRRKSPRRWRAPPKAPTPHGSAGSGQPLGGRS